MPGTLDLESDSDLDTLREEPRFQALLERLEAQKEREQAKKQEKKMQMKMKMKQQEAKLKAEAELRHD